MNAPVRDVDVSRRSRTEGNRVTLSEQDLEDAAMGCRALAFTRRKDAEGAPGTNAEIIARNDAARLTALAARFQEELDRARAAGRR